MLDANFARQRLNQGLFKNHTFPPLRQPPIFRSFAAAKTTLSFPQSSPTTALQLPHKDRFSLFRAPGAVQPDRQESSASGSSSKKPTTGRAERQKIEMQTRLWQEPKRESRIRAPLLEVTLFQISPVSNKSEPAFCNQLLQTLCIVPTMIGPFDVRIRTGRLFRLGHAPPVPMEDILRSGGVCVWRLPKIQASRDRIIY